MEKTPDVEKLHSSLKNVDVTDVILPETAKKVSEDLNTLLKSAKGVSIFKEHKYFEVVFPFYMKVVFYPDPDVAQPCLKLSDVVLEVFRSKLPKIKKEPWWKKFEEGALIKLLDSLESRIETNDDLWVALFTFACAVIISETLNISPLNRLLALSQFAFVKGKVNVSIKNNAWLCWNRVIDAFARSPKSLLPTKIVDLLMRPLMASSHQSESQISTWVHLIEAKEISGTDEILKIVIGKVCKTFYLSENKPACRSFPSACADALNKMISDDCVMKHCLSDIVEVFGVAVCSKPAAEQIDKLAGTLVQAINDISDDGTSYRLWKRLFEQYNACADNHILSSACQKIFTNVKFHRWIESSTIEGNDSVLCTTLMDSRDFREKVLLRSIKALTFNDDSGTPETPKRKSRKGSCEYVWSTYCDAYVSWWSHQSPPPSPKETGTSEAIHSQISSCDHQATQLLLLQPLKNNLWNPTIYKTWSLLCEACHKQKFLRTFVKDIFESIDGRNFALQKAIDVTDCLSKLDSDFCKQSVKLFETISDVIWSMEFQNLTDVLNLSETAVLYPEVSLVVSKICKVANEKSADYDQLNGHKIKTKVSKIMRKLEVISSSAEKEKPAKAQRTPFRTQSNFLQRLAKAEEKNKTKSPFLASLFPSDDKVKVENDEDPQVNGAVRDDGVAGDEKSVNDSEAVPMITLPSVLNSASAFVNSNADGVVAEKENVMLSAISVSTAASPTVGSPKMKVTNAREVKLVDSLSPIVAKKPKPVAGQKSTPKKVTPSKVSYFDDDANDYVMVPPKPKTTPLTEHQMEIMAKRRSDIPALYQDLSQDTQSQQVTDIQEVTTGVSPRPIPESQDIVPGTPSPADIVAGSTPEPRKSSGRACSSAKKLDFNNLSTPPSKKSPMDASFREISPGPDVRISEGKNNPQLVSRLADEPIKEEPLHSKSLPANANGLDETKEELKPAGDEKLKRKRKSEPSKFSPKLTRSKKKQEKSVSPIAKSLGLPGSDSELSVRAKSPVPDLKLPSTSSEERADRSLLDVNTIGRIEADEETCEKSDMELGGSNHKLESRDKSDFQVLLASQEKPKKGRKRKVVESPKDETPKKAKIVSEDGSSTGKKIDSAKKKRKPFKLGAGGNLENWLVKTDRVPTPVPEPGVKCEKPEPAKVAFESNDCKTVQMSSDTAEELDNSDEIVPSTQEHLMGEPVLPVSDVKTEESCETGELLKTEKKGEPTLAVSDVKSDTEEKCKNGQVTTEKGISERGCPRDTVPDEAGCCTPEKPEGSVLERLSHESPNDDDIALVISPSKRHRRAPSVFRGEGDSYLSKEKLYSSETEEDSKVSSRTKNKAASPTSKKRSQQLGGRSAKMIRLATGACAQEEHEEVVVTPVRRRESIVPVKYGENWPKGHVEDWVACTPASPYMSPFRSALKKTPLEYNATRQDENTTPQRMKNDSMASPLLSSAKRKRVMFLDPPVTRGLAYDTDSPGGSIHHADVPQGSPYPTWKGEDVKMEISPSKRDAERLNSLADQKTDIEQPVSVHEERTPNKPSGEIIKFEPDPEPYAASGVSDEVRQLIVSAEPTESSCPEPKTDELREKFKLTDDFMTALSEIDPHLQLLLTRCFQCSSMADTVNGWKVRDCRRICKLPFAFLVSVKNVKGELLSDSLASLDITAPTYKKEFVESSVQTEERSLSNNSSQTHSIQLNDSQSQTDVRQSQNAETNTEMSTSTSSTQADWKRPSTADWPRLLQNTAPKEALLYFSDSLRVFSSSLPNKK